MVKGMRYADRLTRYEEEKRALRYAGLTSAEYDRRIRELARKWRV